MQATKASESTVKALAYLQTHNLPTDMQERVAAFVARPCGTCGGVDWLIDPDDGLLICPCVADARAKSMRLAQQPRTNLSGVRPSGSTSAATTNAWNERAKYAPSVGKRTGQSRRKI